VASGDASRIIADTGAGVTVAPGDPAATGDAIADFVEAVRSGKLRSRAAAGGAAQPYAMSALAERVDEILRAAATGEAMARD